MRVAWVANTTEQCDQARKALGVETFHALKGLLLNSGLAAHGERVSVFEQLAKAGREPELADLDRLTAELLPYSRAQAP